MTPDEAINLRDAALLAAALGDRRYLRGRYYDPVRPTLGYHAAWTRTFRQLRNLHGSCPFKLMDKEFERHPTFITKQNLSLVDDILEEIEALDLADLGVNSPYLYPLLLDIVDGLTHGDRVSTERLEHAASLGGSDRL